ncbi:hypothetical protein [Oryzibacter oryziterrae]|uniref:hypothetical protein n=1 Tax=Oryzibacter oryziterrae TaxID=2766474 RepID=UPI001F2829EA|nr:hypothetical protein [Oryzibacter oryziterrae]
MAKGQVRSTKETRKPKADKNKGKHQVVAASPVTEAFHKPGDPLPHHEHKKKAS